MNILLIGSGGREHALALKLVASPLCDRLYALPGNPGIGEIAENVEEISITDGEAILKFSKEKEIGLVVVGPELPLTEGIADVLTAGGVKVFGPSKAAAELEGSKVFAKRIMSKYRVPTAHCEVFNNASRARVYVRQMGAPIVVKADGLAAGKGVVVAQTVEEALAAVDSMLEEKAFGEAGVRVVMEEFLEGEEASVLAFTDGETIKAMIPSQDHKCIFDGDKGPNTGGMGTYAPAPVVTAEVMERVQKEILEPMIVGMKQEGKPYKGCLYAGLMITKKGPKVIEFNCRFGDPETQVVLPLLDSDLVEVMLACVDGKLAETEVKWSKDAAVCVVMAAKGYPGSYAKGDAITGLDEAKALGCNICEAGTVLKDSVKVTNGGRVLGVVGRAADIKAAAAKAYEGVGKISFKDAYYRRDIAHRALERLEK